MLFKFNVLSTINKPTRVTKTSATAIDNIFINNYLETTFETGIFMTDISDHFPVFIKVKSLKAMTDCHSKIIHLKKRNLKMSNTNKLTNRLKQETWNNVYKSEDTNGAYNAFLSTFLEHFNETCPQEIIAIKSKAIANPWMDKSLLKCSKKSKNFTINFLKIKTMTTKKITKVINIFTKISLKMQKKNITVIKLINANLIAKKHGLSLMS